MNPLLALKPIMAVVYAMQAATTPPPPPPVDTPRSNNVGAIAAAATVGGVFVGYQIGINQPKHSEPVPEPATYAVLAVGVVGLMRRRRRA